MSHKELVPNIYDGCAVNVSEATPRRCSILGVFWGIYLEIARKHPCRGVTLIKLHSSGFIGITILREVFP